MLPTKGHEAKFNTHINPPFKKYFYAGNEFPLNKKNASQMNEEEA